MAPTAAVPPLLVSALQGPITVCSLSALYLRLSIRSLYMLSISSLYALYTLSIRSPSGASLTGASLVGANLEGALFDWAQLAGVSACL